MDTTTVAILASGIGAAGAVAGQLVAAAFTAKRDTKRLAFEQDQAKRAEQLDIDKRFLDLKRETFSNFLRVARRFFRYILTAEVEVDARREAARREMIASAPNVYEEMNMLVAEIELIAPSIVGISGRVREALDEWELHVESNLYHSAGLEHVNGLIDQCVMAMRTSLGLTGTDIDDPLKLRS